MNLLIHLLAISSLTGPSVFNNFPAFFGNVSEPNWNETTFNSSEPKLFAVIEKLNETMNVSAIALEVVKSFEFRPLQIGYEYKTIYNSSSLTVSTTPEPIKLKLN